MLVLDTYFELLKFWSSVEYRRFTEMKVGLFPDSSSNCDSALAAIQELTNHINEVAVTTLSTARQQMTKERGLYTFFTVNRILEAQELMVQFRVPIRIQLPQSLVHESVFSFSSVAFSKVKIN